MAAWPISIREAARRLDVPVAVASILVRTHEIETIPIGTSKGLMEESYDRLAVKAAPFARTAGAYRTRVRQTA